MTGNQRLIECNWYDLVPGETYYYFRNYNNLRRFCFTGEHRGSVIEATNIVNVCPETLEVNNTNPDLKFRAAIIKATVYKDRGNIQEDSKFLSLFE